MANIGTLTADLILNSASFISNFQRAADATASNTAKMRSQMSGLQESVNQISSTFTAFLTGILSVATAQRLISLGASIIEAADNIGSAATRLGTTAEDLQRFRFAAEQADVSVGNLDAALKIFGANLAKGDLVTSQQTLTGALNEYIARIAEAPTFLEKARIASEGFGKQWQTGILLAAAGADQFAKNASNAFVISDRLVRKASEISNAFQAMKNAISVGFATGFLEEFGKGLDTSQQKMQKLNDAATWLGQKFGELGNLAIRALEDIQKWGNVLDILFGGIRDSIDALVAFLDRLLAKINEAVAAINNLWASVPSWAQTAISTGVGLLGGNLAPSGAAMGQGAQPTYPAADQALQAAGSNFLNFVQQDLGNLFTNMAQSAADVYGPIFQTGMDPFFQDMGNKYSDTANKMGLFSSGLDDTTPKVTNLGNNVDGAGGQVTNFGQNVGGAVGYLGNFDSNLDNASGSVNSFGQGLYGLGSAIDACISRLGAFGNGLGAAGLGLNAYGGNVSAGLPVLGTPFRLGTILGKANVDAMKASDLPQIWAGVQAAARRGEEYANAMATAGTTLTWDFIEWQAGIASRYVRVNEAGMYEIAEAYGKRAQNDMTVWLLFQKEAEAKRLAAMQALSTQSTAPAAAPTVDHPVMTGGGGGYSGGFSGTPPPGVQVEKPPTPKPTVYITLEGTTNLFTREQVLALITQINGAVGDGARIVVG